MFHSYEAERSSSTMTVRAPSSAMARVRFDPIAPAPPVTRTLLSAKKRLYASMSLYQPSRLWHVVDLAGPRHVTVHALTNIDLRVMAEVATRPREVHNLGSGREALLAAVPHECSRSCYRVEHDVREFLDTDGPVFAATHVVDLARPEVLNDVRERAARILDVVEDALVSPVDRERHTHKRAMNKYRDDTSVTTVVLVRPIAADGTHADNLRPEHRCVV